MDFKCFVCSLILHGLLKLFSHLHCAHALFDGPGLILQCGQGGCPQTFFTFNSLRKHLLNTHGNNEPDQFIPDNPQNDLEGDQEHADIHHHVYDEENNAMEENDADEDLERGADLQLQKRAALFITALLSQPNVTYATVHRVVEQSSSLIDDIVTSLEHKTVDFLQTLDVDPCSPAYQALIASFHETKKPFSTLQSRYQQEQYFQEELGLIKPRTVVLGNRFDTRVDKSTGLSRQVLVQDTFQYVSLKETLGVVLNNPKVVADMATISPSTDGVKRYYCDGAQFRSHPLFEVCPDALQISLFFDDFEVTNPIGSKRGVHKLGALYYTLQNIPSRLNSTLPHIHLLGLFHSMDRVKYGFNTILEPFMEELAELESDEGMELALSSGVVRKRGTLIQVAADNLGANTLGGFVESFAANYPCRTCMTSRPDMQFCFVDDQCEKRNPENHAIHVQSVMHNPQSVSDHGVKSDCILNKSRYFHITRNYSPDIMHDILEGVGKVECKLILNHLIYVENLFTLDLLNERLSNFSYGFVDIKNKPSEINASSLQNDDSNNFKNTASQMWCLLRCLPILIGDKVPRGNLHWQLLILLRQVMDIAFAREITDTMIAHLLCHIEDHHTLFKRLFPGHNLKPKHHFLVHYPFMCKQVGPLINSWCMRYEAKHAIGKRMANVVCNFKDIAQTIAERHQISQCHRWFTHGVEQKPVVQHVDKKFVRETDGCALLLEKFPTLCRDDEVMVTKSLTLSGTEYRSGMSVAIGAHDCMPIFGKVIAAYCVGSQFCLYGTVWETQGFDDHVHAYEVLPKFPHEYFLLQQNELRSYLPLQAYNLYDERQDMDDLMYISLRSTIILTG